MLTPKSHLQVRLEFQKLRILNTYAGELVAFEKMLTENLARPDLDQNDQAYSTQLLAETTERIRTIHEEVALLMEKTEKGIKRSTMHLV